MPVAQYQMFYGTGLYTQGLHVRKKRPALASIDQDPLTTVFDKQAQPMFSKDISRFGKILYDNGYLHDPLHRKISPVP